MKYINKIASALFSSAVGIMMLASCEGGDLYSVNSPDWLQDKIDSIANSKDPDADEYSFGLTDFSSGWWTAFSKTYVVGDGQKWTAKFNLHINPNATAAYQNFALVLTSDGWTERNGTNYTEYGAIRFDTDLSQSRNSEWGTYINRSCIASNLDITSDADVASLQRLGGEVTLTVDRSAESGIVVTISNDQGVVKTYTQTEQLANINSDPSNSNIDCFLAVEGSYIDFESSNITQVRPVKDDSEPVSIESVNNVPKKVLKGSSIEEALKSITATINYADGSSRDVPASSLSLVAVSDMNVAGTATAVVICNKTYKNQASTNVVSKTISFTIVDKMCTCLGNVDNTSAWWTVFSSPVKIEPKTTYISTFTNYSGGSNWNNWVLFMTKADATEYAVVRADNYGWGTGYGTCTPSCTQTDWAEWLKDMNGAVVTTYVTNNGDGTVDVKAVAKAKDGDEYTQTYTGISGVDPDDMYAKFTVDNSHLEFDQQIGADDNTTAFWGDLSPLYHVAAGTTSTIQFINYSDLAANWDNYLAVLVSDDNETEYCVVRADNFGWGTGYGTCTAACTQTDWAEWAKDMNGARVTLSVTNCGNGTANIKAVAVAQDGDTYTQTYTGITAPSENLSFKITLEKSHQVFDMPAPLGSVSSAWRSAYRFKR